MRSGCYARLPDAPRIHTCLLVLPLDSRSDLSHMSSIHGVLTPELRSFSRIDGANGYEMSMTIHSPHKVLLRTLPAGARFSDW